MHTMEQAQALHHGYKDYEPGFILFAIQATKAAFVVNGKKKRMYFLEDDICHEWREER